MSGTRDEDMAKEDTQKLPVRTSQKPSMIAPLVACILASAVLLVLLIPGVLSYPDDLAAGGVPEVDSALEIVAEHNDIMRQRIGSLTSALEGGVCLADGALVMPEGEMSDAIASALPPTPPTIASTCAGAGGSTSLRQHIDDVTVFVAQLEGSASSGYNILSVGTGFFIRDSQIVTNAHVVLDKETGTVTREIVVFGSGTGRQAATVLAVGNSLGNGGPDLAVLEVASPATSSAVFAEVGTDELTVRSAGFPAHIISKDESFTAFIQDPTAPEPDSFPVVSTGTVIRKQLEDTGTWLYTSAYVDAGNSGGPLFDECGRVVGVITALQSGITSGGGGALGSEIGKALAVESVLTFFENYSLAPPVLVTLDLPERS